MKIIKKLTLCLSVAAVLFIAACSNYTSRSYNEGDPTTPTRSTSYERRVARRSLVRENSYRKSARSSNRRYYRTNDVAPPAAMHPNSAEPTQRQSPPHQPAPKRSAAKRSIPNPAAVQATPQPQPTQIPTTPNVTSGSANNVGTVLASHQTQFNEKEDSRETNIINASNAINGHIVQPGETFSYNKTVGPTIESRGYEEGTIYVQGEKKKGFGGGVCQVSSTLCVAATKAGMTITERHEHSLPVTYATDEQEAATSYGVIDFKFKNEKGFPVVIHSSVDGGNIKVSLSQVGL